MRGRDGLPPIPAWLLTRPRGHYAHRGRDGESSVPRRLNSREVSPECRFPSRRLAPGYELAHNE